MLTNPDMLHVGILPNHAAWADLFANLAVVVVDEAHVYRGVFGSHVANVLRRLRRIAAAYGTEPRFLLASATIANPVELAERLTGLEGVRADRRGRLARAAAADRDVEPAADRRGARHAALGARRGGRAARAAGARGRARDLLHEVAQGRRGAQPPGQAGPRSETDPELAELVAPYRAGYTPQQRRELEGRLMRGELRAVITTDALELGIDIGELDAAVVVTFPGTVASLRQMWGRAGRRGRGLAVYVAGEDALDQFFCRHPDEFLDRPVEAAILDHESPLIYRAHLLCAAHEGPLSRRRRRVPRARAGRRTPSCWRAPGLRRDRRRRQAGAQARTGATCRAGPARYPAAEVSLRSASPESFAIVDVSSGELLGSTEAARAHSTVHEGAIYMHLGRSYEVRELDLERRRALVPPFDGDWYTQPKRETDTEIVRLLDRREALGVTLSFGEVSVTDTVLAYQRRRLADHAPGGPRGARAAADELLDPGAVVRAATRRRAVGRA